MLAVIIKNETLRKNRLTIGSLIIISLFIGSLIVSNQLEPDKFEIRNVILENLLTGILSFWLVTAFLILLVVWNIKRENLKGTRGLSTFILVILGLSSFIVSLLFTTWLPSEKKDAIVFESMNNHKEKIICQFYLSGITGSNPNWRIITTKNQTGIIRRIEVLSSLSITNLPELIDIPKGKPNEEIVEFNNIKYKLQKYMIMKNWNTWITYELKK
jgi:heme A synthase